MSTLFVALAGCSASAKNRIAHRQILAPLRCPAGSEERQLREGDVKSGSEERSCYSLRSGRRHGPFARKQWKAEHTREAAGNYRDGKRQGRWTKTDSRGLRWIGTYSLGKLHGESVFQWRNTRTVTTYERGQVLAIRIFEKDVLVRETLFSGDSRDDWADSFFSPNGELLSTGLVVDRKREGPWKFRSGTGFKAVEFSSGVAVSVDGVPLAEWESGLPACDKLFQRLADGNVPQISPAKATAVVVEILFAGGRPADLERADETCRRLLRVPD